ncbi:hypothetical protein CHCC14821_3967 [Bacillus paralicheniformis]|nr:hypothetical protein CHCC14821_3967 [Bacillus paralicheniformis]
MSSYSLPFFKGFATFVIFIREKEVLYGCSSAKKHIKYVLISVFFT